jgi:hypothetical protein
MKTESKRRFVGWPLLVAFLITVAAFVCSFFMHTRLAVAQMVERDYRPKSIEIAFSQVGWSDQMHFYVEYRVIMPNDGTFFESSVPRMTTWAVWFTRPFGTTGYITDIFPLQR